MDLGSSSYHTCVVPCCKSTTIKTPEKLWVKLPLDQNKRMTWLKLARRDLQSLSEKSNVYFCVDHFDLENDMENYIRYKVMGYVRKIKMKPDCIPTKFDCQIRRSLATDLSVASNKQPNVKLEDSASSYFNQDALNACCQQNESTVTPIRDRNRKSATTEPVLSSNKKKKITAMMMEERLEDTSSFEQVVVKVEPEFLNEESECAKEEAEFLNEETECVKKEAELLNKETEFIKEEPLLDSTDLSCGVSEAAMLSGLYTDHVVKDELVLGLEGMHRSKIANASHEIMEKKKHTKKIFRDTTVEST